MEHIKGLSIEQNRPTAVTLGNFDGVHMGHRRLIQLTKEYAEKENLKSVVFTFWPHPMFIFQNKEHSALIMAPEEKKYAMEQMGIDLYIEYPFTKEFASMSPEDFANDLIFDKMNCKVLVVGENYHFGHRHAGDYKLLMELGKKRGVKVIYVPSVMYGEERVSSTRIRNCLVERDIDMANRLLTVPYYILGTVAQGKKLGRTIGFPTINIVAEPIKLFPPNGVYATKTVYNGKSYFGVTNVGLNPTVNGQYKTVETYLFDFHEVVYGESIKTYFFQWIRDEQKFPNVEALKEQLKRDAQSSLDYFKTDGYRYWAQKY